MPNRLYITVDPVVEGKFTQMVSDMLRTMQAYGWPVTYITTEQRTIVLEVGGPNAITVDAITQAIYKEYHDRVGFYISHTLFMADGPLPLPPQSPVAYVPKSFIVILRTLARANVRLNIWQIEQATRLSNPTISAYLHGAIVRGLVVDYDFKLFHISRAGRDYLNTRTALYMVDLNMQRVLYAFFDNPEHFWSLPSLAEYLDRPVNRVSQEVKLARQQGWVTLAGYGPKPVSGVRPSLFRLKHGAVKKLHEL